LNAPQATHLKNIVDATRASLARRKATTSYEELHERARQHRPRGFAAALRPKATVGPAIIAELKKASPSRGLIRADFDAGTLAGEMADAGATALSVLTEEEFFQGSLENLRAASYAVSVPCLRKDFIVDAFQITEARAYGADAVLLIAAALDYAELVELREAAGMMELDVLCEVHNEAELIRVIDLNCEMIGVNSRNLKTLEVNLGVAQDLADLLPRDCVRVAESGIHSAEDLRRLRACGYEAFLIGESLMKQPNPGAALRALLAAEQEA
jgi:indole-3-glycerol phosphate synthase